jgi:hypothetical protein
MHRAAQSDLETAHRLLDEHDLHIAALNASDCSQKQLLAALRARGSVEGWIYVAERDGETRIALKDLPRITNKRATT